MNEDVKNKISPMDYRGMCNKFSKVALLERLNSETITRKTISFYRYVHIDNPLHIRNQLYQTWDKLHIKGRVYIAIEGINAQISVPEQNFSSFEESISHFFPNTDMKYALEEKVHPFMKLTIKVKPKIVADGLDDGFFDVTNVGNHLNAKQWNEALDQDNTIVIDVRNHYESVIGHFQNALLPDVDTFRQELPIIKETLSGKEDATILLYCTGGIRCEKTSAWLKHHGFKDVNQLHGGIIQYTKQVREEGLQNKFIGKNFVFDNRMTEKITDDVLSHCHTCGSKSDSYINCAWQACHVLFIQCLHCQTKYKQCCCRDCTENLALPIAEQKELLKKSKSDKGQYIKARPVQQ